MAENGDGRIPPLTLSTAIMIVTMFAGLAGTWAVMGERIQNHSEATRDLMARINAIDARLVAAERENATAEIRLENMREALNDLRDRQSAR